jgi:hypothetical protein
LLPKFMGEEQKFGLAMTILMIHQHHNSDSGFLSHCATSTLPQRGGQMNIFTGISVTFLIFTNSTVLVS